MTPADLQPLSFSVYPQQARLLAVAHLATLRRLPLPLLPILLREVSTYDWRFPREQARLRSQLDWLASLSSPEVTGLTLPFSRIEVPTATAAMDWVNDPAGFVEALTASLWSSLQISNFRGAARAYTDAFAAARPDAEAARPRLAMVVFSSSLRADGVAPLTVPAKLRTAALLLTNVDPEGGMRILQDHLQQRATHTPEPFAHWHITGASLRTPVGPAPEPADAQLATSLSPSPVPAVTSVSYGELEPARELLLRRAKAVMSSQRSGPEELRTLMARLSPSDLGLAAGMDPALARFQLSLLTEGSGTQVFATTFVQWAARECLRRAEPETLLAHFTVRQRQQGMNELLSGAPSTGDDPAGSLQDAQMGAYYSWLNLQRLSGAEKARFLLWQEGGSSALAVGPGLPRGTTSASRMNLQQIAELLA